MEAGFFLAFTTGLAGGFGHCIGMCGPIVAMTALRTASDPGPGFFPQLLYHAGRIITYAVIGGLMGLAGSFVNVAGRMMGIQQVVLVLAGLVMTVMGLSIAGLFGSTKWIERHNNAVLSAASRVLSLGSRARFLPLGLLMGLLPCGLSYTVFIAAAGAGSPAAGAVTMLAFGAGTVPALLLFGAAVTWLSSRMRAAVQRAGGIMVVVMGLYYLAKGIRFYAEM
ncbi:MAG: sulfite exporter TauE/SafE family protein [Nitrospirota bacterium]|nr:sulfite exporter TauE/SafE family protein [Nitrospirota bacterium]